MVSVLDIEEVTGFVPDNFDENWLGQIFEKQTKLIEKYADIEGMPAYPFHVDTAEGQKWFKDFLWRISEEVAESYEAVVDLSQGTEDAAVQEVHKNEELIDALHFLVELLILTGRDAAWARQALDNYHQPAIDLSVDKAYLLVHYWLGMVGNTLKMKPWKQDPVLTNQELFDQNLALSLAALFDTLRVNGLDEEAVYQLYQKKNAVNAFRIKSGY